MADHSLPLTAEEVAEWRKRAEWQAHVALDGTVAKEDAAKILRLCETINHLRGERRVTPNEIADQREKGWVDFHPEDFCHRCGSRNLPSWYVDNKLWNAAVGSPDGILCPQCFADDWLAATNTSPAWRLELDQTTLPAEVAVVLVEESDGG